jgi:hypothetical protein
MRRHIPVGIFLLTAGVSAQEGKPAGPRILYPIPLVASPGPKVRVVLRGQRLEAVKEVVASDPAVGVTVVSAKKTSGKGREGDSEVEVELNLPDPPPRGLSLTAVCPGGKSAAYPLPTAGGALPRVAESEYNGGFRTAQLIAVPTAVEGVIRGEKDVDVYRFHGAKGQGVRFEVWSARWGCPTDLALTVYDADGRALATADDGPAGLDPALTVTLPRDGAYFVGVADANDLGGPGWGYRLEIRPDDSGPKPAPR